MPRIDTLVTDYASQDLVDRMYPDWRWMYHSPEDMTRCWVPYPRMGRRRWYPHVHAPILQPMDAPNGQVRTVGTFTDKPNDWDHLAYV